MNHLNWKASNQSVIDNDGAFNSMINEAIDRLDRQSISNNGTIANIFLLLYSIPSSSIHLLLLLLLWLAMPSNPFIHLIEFNWPHIERKTGRLLVLRWLWCKVANWPIADGRTRREDDKSPTHPKTKVVTIRGIHTITIQMDQTWQQVSFDLQKH